MAKEKISWQDALGALLPNSLPDSSAEEAVEASAESVAAKQPRLDIVYEKKGRAGKPATIIAGFTLADSDVEALASEMKKQMGCGGSARGGEILLQGDRRRQALDFLTRRNLKARII